MIGSYLYGNEDASLRNKAQKRAMEESRLGIPILFGTDVIHGFRSIYPIGLAKGCNYDGQDTTAYANAVEAVQKADVAVLCLGERSSWTGENASRA